VVRKETVVWPVPNGLPRVNERDRAIGRSLRGRGSASPRRDRQPLAQPGRGKLDEGLRESGAQAGELDEVHGDGSLLERGEHHLQLSPPARVPRPRTCSRASARSETRHCARRRRTSRQNPEEPPDYAAVIEHTRTICSPHDKAWLLTASDFVGTAETGHAWNEWERDSLEAAGGDQWWRRSIEAFGNDHLPVLMSVKAGYAYFAIEKSTLRVVCGEEPEYEDTTVVASSVKEMPRLIAARDPQVARWI